MRNSVAVRPKYMTASEAAAYIGFSAKWAKKSLVRWVREGKLRAGRAGNRWRFTEEQLDAFLARGGRVR